MSEYTTIAAGGQKRKRQRPFGDLLLERGPRRRPARGEPLLDRLLRGGIGEILAVRLRLVEGDVREHVDRGVEQHCPLDAVRLARCQLVDEPSAVGVPDPGRAAYAGRVDRLEQVVELLRDRPGRLPLRAAMAAEVRREHTTVR